MEKYKITEHQLFALTANFTCGSAILIIAASVTEIAKQDAWISSLFTLVFGIIVIWIISYIGSQYPEMTLIEIIQQILGKWVGWIVAAVFVFYCIIIAPQLPWYLGNFITTQSMPETPGYAVNMLFIAATVTAVLYGIEAITRASEIFIVFVSLLFISAMLLVSPNAQTENLLPLFEQGILPVLAGSFFQSCVLTFPSIILFMIYPFSTNNIQKAKKALFKGYLWAGFLIFLSILMSILVLGSTVTARSQYPIYLLAKRINLGAMFSRIEFIVAAVWITTLFIRNVLYFNAGVLGLAQLLGLKNYKVLVLPLGLITLVMSQIVYPDVGYQAHWDLYTWPPFITTLGFVLPLLLLFVHVIKKLVLKKSGEGT